MAGERPLKLLAFTTLYPSIERPRHGIFVETRLRHLARQSGCSVEVVAAVPWFPSGARCFGEYARFARTPRVEMRDGFRVHHPRYLMPPVGGMYTQPFALARATEAVVRAVREGGFDFDLIDAHYFYPDGVAAALLARRLGKPFVITARGSDVNVIANHRFPRRLIVRAARQAAAVIAVSTPLKERLVELGVPASKVVVLRNGVDTAMFAPIPRDEAREQLGIGAGPVIAAVGNLVPEKGFDVAIDALALLSEATLLIVGEGPEREKLLKRARDSNVGARVRFLPVRAQQDLPIVYSAADVLVHPSWREGWPNVLLEAMACGTPVVVSNVGGVPEIVTKRDAGIVVDERAPSRFAAAVRSLLDDPPQRRDVRRHAERYGWADVIERQAALYAQVAAAQGARSSTAMPG